MYLHGVLLNELRAGAILSLPYLSDFSIKDTTKRRNLPDG
jgi:hypothetical protein